MEFRNQEKEIGMPSSSLGYNPPPPLRASAFSRPTLSPSSSLISPRVGGGLSGSSINNGNIFASNPTPPPPQPPLTLSSISPAAIDHSSPSQSPPKSQEPASAPSNSSPNSWATTTAVKSLTTAATTSTAADVSFRYRECLRNHAASIGGHVLDGCGEFMPDGAPDIPEALKCVACGCHRSFHRKEANGDTANAASSLYRAADGGGAGVSASHLTLLLPSPHPPSHQHSLHTLRQFQLSGFSPSPSVGLPGSSGIVAFGANTSGGTTESSSEERINVAALIPTAAPRKRFRTKFTAEQKEKMLAFAERIGWRIQKQDESAVEHFCAEIGVRRQVLKVWMHNNKHIIKKHQQQLPEHDQMQAQRHRQQAQSHHP